MPARRDMLTGRLGFLERNWGPIEPFDRTLPELLAQKSIRSHMITDHYHYLEHGGEGYCQSFTTWQFHRGQEHDNMEWMEPPYHEPDHVGKTSEYYQNNRRGFTGEEVYPSPKTYQAAAEWLERHGGEDNFLLWVEGFDPHEPFDVPEKYLAMYNDTYDGPLCEWPTYAPFAGSDEELRHIRNRYKATLTMTDHWIGRLLEVCDRQNLWDDTMIIFTTDHGFMLGEHGLMAKNYMQGYNELYHIPMMIHQPGQTTENRIPALTQNTDLFPTICAHFSIDPKNFMHSIHGKDLSPIMNGEVASVREGVLYGVYGKSVNVCDGRHTFFKSPVREDNTPLNIYASMLTTINQRIGVDSLNDPEVVETGPFLKWTQFPVYRVPAHQFHFSDTTQRFTERTQYHDKDYLFDIEHDYEQQNDLDDPDTHTRMSELLARLMVEHDAPDDQFERLGLPVV